MKINEVHINKLVAASSERDFKDATIKAITPLLRRWPLKISSQDFGEAMLVEIEKIEAVKKGQPYRKIEGKDARELFLDTTKHEIARLQQRASMKSSDLNSMRCYKLNDLSEAVDIIKCNNHKLTVVDTAMDSGKSFHLGRFLSKIDGSVTTIPLIALIALMPKEHRGKPSDYKVKATDRKCLITVTNSVMRKDLIAMTEHPKMLIIEELSTQIEAFSSKTFGKDFAERMAIQKHFKKMIRNAKKVVVLDATLSPKVLKFITDAAGIDPIEAVRIGLKEPKKEDRKVLIADKEGDVYSKIADEVSKGGKAALFTDGSLAEGHDEIMRALKMLNPDMKIGQFTSESKKTFEEVVKESDVVLISPVITSGVSITADDITAAFGIFRGTVSTSSIVQMTGRFRKVKTTTIYAKRVGTGFENMLGFLGQVSKGTALSIEYIKNIEKKPEHIFCAETLMHKQALNNNLEQSLCLAFSSIGIEVEPLSINAEKSTNAKIAKRAAKKASTEDRFAKVAASRLMSKEEYSSEIKAKEKTRTSMILLERYSIEQHFKTTKNNIKKVVEHDNKGKIRKMIDLHTDIKRSEAETAHGIICQKLISSLKVNKKTLKGSFTQEEMIFAIKFMMMSTYKINGFTQNCRSVLASLGLVSAIRKGTSGKVSIEVLFKKTGIEIEKVGTRYRFKTDTAVIIETSKISRTKLIYTRDDDLDLAI